MFFLSVSCVRCRCVVGGAEADECHGVRDGGVECIGSENMHTCKHGDAGVVT